MTTPKRPESIADLPEQDTWSEGIRIVLPPSSELIDKPEIAAAFGRVIGHALEAFEDLYGATSIKVSQVGDVFGIQVPSSDSTRQMWLGIRQAEWDEAADEKVGGSE